MGDSFRRRGIVSAASVAAVVACTRTPRPQVGPPVVPPGGAVYEEVPPVATQAGGGSRSVVVAPPAVQMQRLAPQQIERVVQPFWSPDSARVMFYDQPAPDAGGTWSVDVGSGNVQRERSDWGAYLAKGALLAIPLPNERQTWVKHLGAGTEWALPTSGGTVFSPDATLVAFTAAGGLVVAGADGQGAQRLRIPLTGATALAWLPGADGTPNARLLVYQARRGEEAGLWAYHLQTGRLGQLARGTRIPGYLLSPDGSWLAHISMWNGDPNENGLWITRTDGSFRRRVPLMGSSRWTPDNRLLVMPARASAAESHQLWEVHPQTGGIRQLVGPEQAQFRVANGDWDLSPDGRQIVFVSADDKGLWRLSVPSLPENARNADGVVPPQVSDPPLTGSGPKPYRLPFEKAAGPDGWYVSQWYGVTTAGYRWRTSSYGQGQGIHFGVDFAAPMRTPVVAVAPGRVIAVDGDYGSPPHNMVL
ncbi:MAG TPA: hypothetical protein VGW38_28680, partial [Chloroflexota bacterium]|nr:hypothetical protein [Chloroflexota bacterium]